MSFLIHEVSLYFGNQLFKQNLNTIEYARCNTSIDQFLLILHYMSSDCALQVASIVLITLSYLHNLSRIMILHLYGPHLFQSLITEFIY